MSNVFRTCLYCSYAVNCIAAYGTALIIWTRLPLYKARKFSRLTISLNPEKTPARRHIFIYTCAYKYFALFTTVVLVQEFTFLPKCL